MKNIYIYFFFFLKNKILSLNNSEINETNIKKKNQDKNDINEKINTENEKKFNESTNNLKIPELKSFIENLSRNPNNKKIDKILIFLIIFYFLIDFKINYMENEELENTYKNFYYFEIDFNIRNKNYFLINIVYVISNLLVIIFPVNSLFFFQIIVVLTSICFPLAFIEIKNIFSNFYLLSKSLFFGLLPYRLMQNYNEKSIQEKKIINSLKYYVSEFEKTPLYFGNIQEDSFLIL